MRTAEGFTLHMQWIEQFVREAEQALEQENVKTTAQTVLFYAGMHVQIEKQSALQTGQPPSQPHVRGMEATNDWLLAPEEEIVKEALKLAPPSFHRLLQLSLRTVLEDEEISLSAGERTYIHTYAGLYIGRVKEQVGQLATHWLH
jgi:hypothetical protein